MGQKLMLGGGSLSLLPRLLSVSAIAWVAVSCATELRVESPEVQTGVVRNEHGAPVPGAYVIGKWFVQRMGMVGSMSCEYVSATTTGPDGAYRLPSWKGRAPTQVVFYKAGMWPHERLDGSKHIDQWLSPNPPASTDFALRNVFADASCNLERDKTMLGFWKEFRAGLDQLPESEQTNALRIAIEREERAVR